MYHIYFSLLESNSCIKQLENNSKLSNFIILMTYSRLLMTSFEFTNIKPN